MDHKLLRGVIAQAAARGETWLCFSRGSQVWLFICEMSLALSRERGAPVLVVRQYDEDAAVTDSGSWRYAPGPGTDAAWAKTAFGLRDWVPEAVTTGLPRLTPAEAHGCGVRSIVIGVANRGGVLADSWILKLLEALQAGLDVVSGMHGRTTGHRSRMRSASRAGLTPNVAITAHDADVIQTYVRLGLGVGIVAPMAVDPEDPLLLAIDAKHLFSVHTTWLGLRRGTLLRKYMLDFAQLLAPHLDRRLVDRIHPGPPQQHPFAPLASMRTTSRSFQRIVGSKFAPSQPM